MDNPELHMHRNEILHIQTHTEAEVKEEDDLRCGEHYYVVHFLFRFIGEPYSRIQDSSGPTSE